MKNPEEHHGITNEDLESIRREVAPTKEWLLRRFASERQEFHEHLVGIRRKLEQQSASVNTFRAVVERVTARVREIGKDLSLKHQVFLSSLTGELVPVGARGSGEFLPETIEGQDLACAIGSGHFIVSVTRHQGHLMLSVRFDLQETDNEPAKLRVFDGETGDLIDGPRAITANGMSVNFPDPLPGIYEFRLIWRNEARAIFLELTD